MEYVVFFFTQKAAYELRISDWSSDVCSSDLRDTAPFSRSIAASPSRSTFSRADGLSSMPGDICAAARPAMPATSASATASTARRLAADGLHIGIDTILHEIGRAHV